jgi:hypothetical protein
MAVIVFLVLLPQLVAVAGAVKETQVLLVAVGAVAAAGLLTLVVWARPVKGMLAEPVTNQAPITVLVAVVGRVLSALLRQQVKVATVERGLLLQLLAVQ